MTPAQHLTKIVLMGFHFYHDDRLRFESGLQSRLKHDVYFTKNTADFMSIGLFSPSNNNRLFVLCLKTPEEGILPSGAPAYPGLCS